MPDQTKISTTRPGSKHPPEKSKGILSDIKLFLLKKPQIETLVKFNSLEERELYSKSILQRIGIGVEQYRLLNIHRIGIEAPIGHVFEELLRWNGDSSCWPNHIAKIELQDDHLENLQVYLFGISKHFLGIKRGFLGLHLFHLFHLKAIRIQRMPDPFDFDNARYLLYESSGGYPIGVFSMYVRTSIPERGEKEMTQLFMLVGFNFYGMKNLSKVSLVNKIWEGIHNRASAHIAGRFKQLCEWRFEKMTEGDGPASIK
ncbi:MAG: hypothetical protein WCO63_12775 [Bacteroidota bacterium]